MKKNLLWALLLFFNHLSAENNMNCPNLSGRVITEEDPGYNESRLVSNFYTSKNKFPKVIVYCQNSDDVQNAVRWARCKKVPVRIRSGGHCHEAFSTGSDVIVIDVSEMKSLHVDKEKNVAHLQPGLTGQELYNKLYAMGLTQVGGTCPEVGVSGLILTGGMGPLLRRQGLACDNLLAFEIVNANGDLIKVTKDNEYKDLFWAACGAGGGNFGVVTSLTIKVYPAKAVTWFNIGWDWNQPMDQILAAWQKFFLNNDKRWFSHIDLWAKPFPKDKFHKQPFKVLGVFWGTPEEARRELAPILNVGQPNEQTIEQVTWDRAIRLFEESTKVYITGMPEYKSTGTFAMQPLPEKAINIIQDALQKTSSPLFNVLMFSLGGAAAEIPPHETAYFYRDAKSFICYSIQWLQENQSVAQTLEVDTLREKLLPYTQGDYIGNPDRHLKDYMKEYFGGNSQRLREIKRKYDPNNVFNFEQSIPL